MSKVLQCGGADPSARTAVGGEELSFHTLTVRVQSSHGVWLEVKVHLKDFLPPTLSSPVDLAASSIVVPSGLVTSAVAPKFQGIGPVLVTV